MLRKQISTASPLRHNYQVLSESSYHVHPISWQAHFLNQQLYTIQHQLYRNMSTNARARRNRAERKQFLENDDNENVIGVMDQDPPKTKIEEKQEDLFDPHQLQQNILTHHNHNHQPFIEFEDEQSTLSEPVLQQSESVISNKQSGRKQRKRERGKRQVKKYDSDEQKGEVQQKGQKEQKRPQSSIFEEGEQLEEEELDMSTNTGRREQEEQQAKEQAQARLQAEKMKAMVSKKTPSPTDDYLLMHVLINNTSGSREERKKAVYTPLGANKHSFVYFKRYQSGFSEYYQAIGQDQRPIFFCENQRGCIGCNYYISLTKEMDKNNPAYLGKLRGNAAGSIYQLYDHGIQPSAQEDPSKLRASMAYIEYQSNFLGMKGPRKFKAVIPKATTVQDYDKFKFAGDQSLTDLKDNVVRLRNKQPRWNDRLKSYALNFGGRVKQASIKNFILCEETFDLEQEDKAPNAIVFGKIDENTFALEFRHPLSLYQAFGIAMSEFDFKLKCE